MRIHEPPTLASQEYAAAYAANYQRKEVSLALQLYSHVLKAYPAAPEAEYARMQIQNIVNAVVPKEELLDAQLDMAFAHMNPNAKPGQS